MARQKRADEKVDRQGAAVRIMNGHAKEDPGEQQTLNEMRHNKAAVDYQAHCLVEDDRF